RVGGIGVAMGYFGSFLAVALGLILGTSDKPLLFVWIAALFLFFALPCFFFVQERGNLFPKPIDLQMIRNSIRETVRTVRSTQEYPGLLRFLIGRVFYTDAINTVIAVMALYTVNAAVSGGMSSAEGERTAQWVMMLGITFAVAGGWFWGILADRIGPKATLNLVLKIWLAVFLFAALIGFLRLPLWSVYLLGASAGFVLGGIWSADRPLMLLLSPPARIGEFYGLYGMVGRFSAVTGPGIWALVTFVSHRMFGLSPLTGQAAAILVLLLMTWVGYMILKPIPEMKPANAFLAKT
ncbi:MAG TPA: MFS transporter, partial [Bdellovibrionota bacterium]|nr:MFS transporter [Bdellovibrionota bacterium]